MANEPEFDWQETFMQEVRTNDGAIVGVVAGIRRDVLIVQDQPKNEYLVQKQDVEGFTGNKVNLAMSKNELEGKKANTKSEPPVIDWDATFKKGVRTKDGLGVGVVVKAHGDTIAIQDNPKKEYILPKDAVEEFDGHELYLGVTKSELEKYEAKI
jgi:hypothetical protein